MTALMRGDVQMAAAAGDRGDAACRDRRGEDPCESRCAKRSPLLPDIPTLKESGIDVEADAWNGLIAPGEHAGRDDREDSPRGGRSDHARKPAIREKLATQMMEPIGNTPAEFRAEIDGELARWAPVIKAGGHQGELGGYPSAMGEL